MTIFLNNCTCNQTKILIYNLLYFPSLNKIRPLETCNEYWNYTIELFFLTGWFVQQFPNSTKVSLEKFASHIRQANIGKLLTVYELAFVLFHYFVPVNMLTINYKKNRTSFRWTPFYRTFVVFFLPVSSGIRITTFCNLNLCYLRQMEFRLNEISKVLLRILITPNERLDYS